jgi:hypothetical protein
MKSLCEDGAEEKNPESGAEALKACARRRRRAPVTLLSSRLAAAHAVGATR